MCGIYLALTNTHHLLPQDRIRQLLCRRGPDACRELEQESSNLFLTCFSTVLALRGDHTVVQPIQHDTHPHSFLCWNGEAWKLNDNSVSGNDSEHVFSLLAQALHHSSTHSLPAEDAVQESLTKISGPYAFACFDPHSQTLFFGRDPLGRRSLLYRFDQHANFFLSTISDSSEPGWHEVEADGIYSINLPAFREAKLQNLPYSPACIPHLHPPNLTTLTSSSPEAPLSRPQVAQPLTTHSPEVAMIEQLLRRSLQLRVLNIPLHPTPDSAIPSASLAVLFSGGLDCTLLARMTHDILVPNQPIDLINVAFENPRVHRRPANHPDDQPFSPYELCPDRITGRASFAELQNVCPARSWRFLAVNIPYEETLAHRDEVISLIYPHNTEMDLSIACALYFASRGDGLLYSTNETATPYTTNARVLLSGLGADELFGGYTRHTTAFNRNGFPGLLDELNLDVGRLGKRNLGRDDRVLSNWARETRFPFLDEKLVFWTVKAPIWKRCGFGENVDRQSRDNVESTDGQDEVDRSLYLDPEKKALRCLAWKLGMKNVAAEKKRAIQFGARTAKMEVGRTKGTQPIT